MNSVPTALSRSNAESQLQSRRDFFDLSSLRLFRGIDANYIAELNRHAKFDELRKNGTISASPSQLIVVVDGWVGRANFNSEGRCTILQISGKSDYLPLLDDQRSYLQTLSHTQFVRLPLALVQDIAVQSPLLWRNMAHVQSQYIRDFENTIVLSRLEAVEKVANFLLWCHFRIEASQEDGMGLAPGSRTVVPFSQGDIGNYIDLSRESVNKTIPMLRETNIVSTEYESIHILNVEDLCRLCAFESLDDARTTYLVSNGTTAAPLQRITVLPAPPPENYREFRQGRNEVSLRPPPQRRIGFPAGDADAADKRVRIPKGTVASSLPSARQAAAALSTRTAAEASNAMNAAAGWDKAVAKDNGVFAQKDTPATSPQSADAPAAPLLKAAVTVPPHIDLAPSIAERPLAKLPWARLHLSSFIQACVRQEPSIKSIGELAAIIRTSRSDIPVGNVLKALSGQVDILYTVQNGFSATGEAMAAAARLSPEAAFAKALATKNIRVGVRPDPGIALDGKAPIL